MCNFNKNVFETMLFDFGSDVPKPKNEDLLILTRRIVGHKTHPYPFLKI